MYSSSFASAAFVTPPLRLEACLFDLDGTLLDSLEDLANAVNETLREHAYTEHSLDAYRYFVGNGLETLVRRALPCDAREHDDVVAFAVVLERVRTRYDMTWHACTRPYAGIVAMLKALTDASFPMAVLSNKPDPWTRVMVQHFFPGVTFRVVRGALPDVPKKPHPEAALQVAAAMGFVPNAASALPTIAFVGDSNVDIRTGVAAGMHAIGVSWGFRTVEELQEAGAAAIVHAPHELVTRFIG